MAGDHQWHMEYNLPYDQVVGVVKGIYRKEKYISCETFLIKLYTWIVVLLAGPRIRLWQFIRFLLRPLYSAISLVVIRQKGKEQTDDH